MNNTIRKRIHYLLQVASKKDASYYVDLGIMILIVLSVLDIILESEPFLKEHFGNYFDAFEIFTILVFSVEYILRLWTCVETKAYSGKFGRLKYATSFMSIIDLLAILPFYLPFIGLDLRMLRSLRLFRVFRLFKMARYTSAFDLIRNALKNKKEELVITSIFIVIALLVISTLMYYLEREAQPNKLRSLQGDPCIKYVIYYIYVCKNK